MLKYPRIKESDFGMTCFMFLSAAGGENALLFLDGNAQAAQGILDERELTT